MASQIIVIGGGLAGLSAAHSVIQAGGNVLLLDKSSFCGGNSTKATSGINGAGTRSQRSKGVPDTPEIFEEDTKISAKEGYKADLVKVLTHQSAQAVEWLMDDFGLDLSLTSRLGGHSQERTHRGKERFPGMTITYALLEALEKIAEETPNRARIINKARANKLVTDASGAVIGAEYEKDGQTFTEHGNVILATGGFGADFSQDSLLSKVSQEWRGLSAWNNVRTLPNLMDLPTTNGDHCTGDGLKMACDIGAGTVDMEAVQVHPTGLVNPDEPDAKLKFLAAEALRGVGGILIDADGNRFCDDLGKRDYVTSMMWNGKAPFRLVLNSKAAEEIHWHIKHYVGRGLMKEFKTGQDLANEMGVPVSNLEKSFNSYNSFAKNKNDPWGKRFFHNVPFFVEDSFYVSVVTPVVHYTIGGLLMTPAAEVQKTGGEVIPGLWCTGEIMGGVHGKNRLGGNSLLDCVVFGRVSGKSAAKYLLSSNLSGSGSGAAQSRLQTIAGHLAPISINIDPSSGRMNIDIDISGSGSGSVAAAPAAGASAAPAEAAAAPAEAAAPAGPKTFTAEEVAKHDKESDCWVVVNGEVLDVTEFMHEHPGGKKAILLFAGKDASEEFNMLHKPDVVKKYAADSILGTLA